MGNAVPPPLARNIATEVINALGKQRIKPAEPIDLGDETLLYMELSEAAEHFGVEKPSSRRDKKSGAKKRKQSETEASRLSRLRLING